MFEARSSSQIGLSFLGFDLLPLVYATNSLYCYTLIYNADPLEMFWNTIAGGDLLMLGDY